jgi:Na+/melibiose symporter-like transporter
VAGIVLAFSVVPGLLIAISLIPLVRYRLRKEDIDGI